MLTFLHYFLMTVEVVSSILLLGVILIQRSKGQGMGTALGGGVGETMFGSQVGNVLTRTTVILAVVFLVNTTILAILGARGRESSAVDQARAVPVPTSAPVGQGPQGVSGSAPLPADFGGQAMPADEVPMAPMAPMAVEPVTLPPPSDATTAPLDMPAAPTE